MIRKVGLWIDDKRAVIVFLAGKEEEIKRITSNVERHIRSSGGSRSATPYGPQNVSAEDNRQRKLEGHLSRYYHEVISCIGDAESILIIGPGDAKRELKEDIGKNKLGDRVVGIETVDKMTDRQIAAKVREHLLK